jgi:hypothetical protein
MIQREASNRKRRPSDIGVSQNLGGRMELASSSGK